MIKKFSISLIAIITMAIAIGIVGVYDISAIKSKMCGDDGLYITDSSGNTTFVTTANYVDRPIYASETIDVDGDQYFKEGITTLLDIDCDVKEAFDIIKFDEVQMKVKMTIGDVELYQSYVRGSDGYTYLVRTDKYGNILRDKDGFPDIIKRCDFANLYLESE